MFTNIVLAVLIAWFVIAGMKDGFVYTMGRLIGAIVGFVAARAWSGWLGGFLAFVMPAVYAKLIAFILIFLVCEHLIGVIFKIIDGFVSFLNLVPFLRSVNSILGLIAGFIEGIIVIGGVLYLIHTILTEPHLISWSSGSVIAQMILRAFKLFLGILL